MMMVSEETSLDGMKTIPDAKDALMETKVKEENDDDVLSSIKSATTTSNLVTDDCKNVTKSRGLTFLELTAKRVSNCGIPSCNVKCDRLTFASSSALAYFGIKDRLAMVKICPECKEKAEQFEKKSVEAVRNSESIFKVKYEPHNMLPETVNLDDDDIPTDVSGSVKPSTSTLQRNSELLEVDFERKDVEGIVKNIMKKFNIEEQIKKCTKKCVDETNKLEREMGDLNDMIVSVDNLLYDTCRKYNNVFDKRPMPVVVEEVEINANGSVRRRNVTEDEAVFINSESLKKLAKMTKRSPENMFASPSTEQPNLESDLNKSIVSLPDTPARKPGPASKTGYYEALDAKTRPPEERAPRPPRILLPTPTVIPKKLPKTGDYVYAMSRNLLSFWLKGEILEVVRNDVTNQTEYVVIYEPTKNGKPTGGIEGDGIISLIRQLCLKQLAYNIPCPFILPVGSRVIAKFKDEFITDPDVNDKYYAGIVAEVPKQQAKHRYLIFFDDGYAQYVHPDDVLMVCESSQHVWNDVYPDSYDFIKQYVTKWPNWPMVKLHIGAIVATERNGMWLPARIIEVDNCIAKVKFMNDSLEEWIYRGSTRFRPIYKTLEKEENLKEAQLENGSKENKIPRHDPEEYKNRNVPAIEYKGGDDDITALAKGARKSTSGRINYFEELSLFTRGALPSNTINMLDPDLCIEFQGTLSKIKIPADAPRPKQFVPHTCSSACVVEYVPSKELKRLSPLAIPLHFGWDREVCRSPRHVVFYRSPCGVRLRDCDELSKYLDMTNSNLSIDHFCFDYAVDCLSEFVPARALRNVKDISYGKEGAPVHCINSVDYDDLPYMEYTPNRIFGPNVEMNTDENFLVCCDCTDNCQDKDKCACWKLTHEGISFSKLNDEKDPTVGYEHRRLRHHIVSGIYECNSRCKCKKTCSNRVVQNGVQWPLQIFKTTKKGWGIRAVYDMPEGTFICIYSGQILNGQTANEDGIENGDEYLVELDYMECNEAVKEDYESDITDIEAKDEDVDSDEDSDTSASEKPKKMRAKSINIDKDDGEEPDEEDSESERDGQADDASLASKISLVGSGQKIKFAMMRTSGEKRYIDYNSLTNNDDDIITARATHFSPKVSASGKKRKRISTRQLYGPKEQCFIMDAKHKGNIGRYLNHACTPNVFVQNVFVDTHDIRFPIVAFFTNSLVKAGTELTWDYHYQIGSVPGKMLNCFCMQPKCRGRLL